MPTTEKAAHQPFLDALKKMSLDEVRHRYKLFLQSQKFASGTITSACTDSFYLWRKGDHDLFWKAVESSDADAKSILLDVLRKSSTGDIEKLVSEYLSHLRRFRRFLASEGAAEVKTEQPALPAQPAAPVQRRKNLDIDVPTPSKEQVEHYLAKWDTLESYRLQENALNALFFKLCPKNTDISDILLKVTTLNDFYSTNIYSVYPMAQHILSLNIDARLEAGDITLVNDIRHIARDCYSFATKYCSHHNPSAYPIYDSFVDKVLKYFRNRDSFASFTNEELKNYARFKDLLIEFQAFYGISDYNLKLLDKYLWLLGKDYFKKESKKKG